MAHPYHHSLSSVRSFGGEVNDYLSVHSWMDETKRCFADFRHRALRHHRGGVSLATELFGTYLTRRYPQIKTEDVLLRHVQEDCGFIPEPTDWLKGYRNPRWFKGILLDEQSCYSLLVKRFPGLATQSEKAKVLIAWFYHPFDLDVHTTIGAPLFRSHSEGIFLAESLFGTLLDKDAAPVYPIRTLAESIVKFQLGCIPTPMDWLRNIQGQYWMVKTQKIEAKL